jgi:ACS family tartrate transporter-like MFS transporter
MAGRQVRSDLRSATLAKVTRRIVPFAFICYVVAYIDRVNIGFAAKELQRDLHLSDTEYGIGAGLFFLGYCLFEIPSNLILDRVGARLWMARIMVVWGLVSMATMFIYDSTTFYAARVLLGVAEAGFFPGIVLYLTYWIPASERARNNALFMTAAPIAMIVGAPLSGMILTLDGWLGLSGWQWLFVLEGFPAVILGVMALWVFTDRPEQAVWLEADERQWLTRTMNDERATRVEHSHRSVWRSLANGKVWLLSFAYFLNALVTYGVFLWLPKILQDASGLKGIRLGMVTAIPFFVALVGMVVIGAHSDRTGERKRHVAACALTAATGLVLAVMFQDSVPLLVLSFALSQLGQRSVISVFWAIPPMLLGGTAAAAGIALINSIGNLGGAVGPSVMGWLREGTSSYSAGLLVLAAALVIEAVLIMSLKLPGQSMRSADRSVPVPADGRAGS